MIAKCSRNINRHKNKNLTRGGSHKLANLQLLHAVCHDKKVLKETL